MKKLNIILVSLFVSSCGTNIKIHNSTICSVAGKLAAGAICADTLSDTTKDLDLNEFIEFLEPNELTGKGPAVAMSSQDFMEIKTSLQQACTSLGNKCEYETKRVIKTMERLTEQLDLR